MNRGSAGARALNLALQAALNPPQPARPEIERFGFTYRIGDKVMQIENNYDRNVFNGDLGFISAIDMEEAELLVDFDGRAVSYPFGEFDELTPAFATTIHKSQGSEYPAVVIPILTQHYTMLQRNLLYTGITRGKQLVVLIGQQKAIAMAVRNRQGRRRWSRLRELLSADVRGMS
jgi:exodeoxyribonuclease V alpha subunit